MAFIESFTRPFMLAVMLWPFLSFVLTLPVLALLYHREPHPVHVGVDRISDCAVPAGACMLHHVSDAGRSHGLLCRASLATTAEPVRIHS